MSIRKKVIIGSIGFLVVAAMVAAGVVFGNKAEFCTPEEVGRQ